MTSNNDIRVIFLPKMLKAVILDDEPAGSRALQEKLLPYKDRIEILAIFNDPLEALANMNQLSFDVLFLDVEMPILNGFDFLEKLGSFRFDVIFVTAYSNYVLHALRVHALDYLLKPVDEEELSDCIKRLVEKKANEGGVTPAQSDTSVLTNRIALSTTEGIHIIKHENIVRVEATGNYSNFHLSDGRKIVVSRTLGDYETRLGQYPCFLRINRSAIVNLEFVCKYRKGEGGTLELLNGTELEVSLSKKEELLRRLLI